MTDRRFRVDAFAKSGQRVASETVEADASDTALHEMAERCPKATTFAATEVTNPEDPFKRFSQDGYEIPADAPTNHNGVDDEIPMWQYRRYLNAVRSFMQLRAKAGESPSQTLGVRNGAWAHHLMDRLIEVADDPERCEHETKRLEETIRQMRRRRD